jgi:hypothetical protein
VDLIQVVHGQPLFRFSCHFHRKAWQTTLDCNLQRVWPSHPHFLHLVWSPLWAPVWSLSKVLCLVQCLATWCEGCFSSICLWVCRQWVEALVVRHLVSQAYKRTNFTYILNILTGCHFDGCSLFSPWSSL